MYTEKALKAAADIIKQVAREHHISEALMRTDMKEAMNTGRASPDPAVQAKWASFHCSGAEPTLEEFIVWVATIITCDGHTFEFL